MQTHTHNSFVLVSWWCRANLAPRSLFHYTSAKMKPFFGQWVVSRRADDWVGRPMFVHCVHVKHETDVECLHTWKKEYETKFIMRLRSPDYEHWTLLRQGKTMAAPLSLKRLRTDLCALFTGILWQRRRLFRSTHFRLNELWDNARTMSLRNWMRQTRNYKTPDDCAQNEMNWCFIFRWITMTSNVRGTKRSRRRNILHFICLFGVFSFSPGDMTFLSLTHTAGETARSSPISGTEMRKNIFNWIESIVCLSRGKILPNQLLSLAQNIPLGRRRINELFAQLFAHSFIRRRVPIVCVKLSLSTNDFQRRKHKQQTPSLLHCWAEPRKKYKYSIQL